MSAIIEGFHRTRDRLRRANLELQQTELQFKTLASTIPEIVFTSTSDGTRDYVNQSYRDYTGFEHERAAAEWKESIHPEDRQSVLDLWSKSVHAGTEFSAMYRIRRADGEYRWFKGHAKPVRSGGEIVHWTGVTADIGASSNLRAS